MRHRQAALGHHLYQVAQTELEPQIPPHAQDDDFAVELPTFEQLRYRLQLAHRRPQPDQHAKIADRAPSLAPEPCVRPLSPTGVRTRRTAGGEWIRTFSSAILIML